MKYEKTNRRENVKRYNLRRLEGRKINGPSLNKHKIGKPTISKYNLRSRKPTQLPSPPTIKERRKQANQEIVQKNKQPSQASKPVQPTNSKKRKQKEVDLDEEGEDTEIEFTWDDFNTYQSADGYNNNIADDDKRNWVSATGVKNYLMKEPLIDWFDLYYVDRGYNENIGSSISDQQLSQSQFQPANLFLAERNKKRKDIEDEMSSLHLFFEMGIKFEAEVIKYLRDKFPGLVQKVVTSRGVTADLNNLTLKYMSEGVPIIEQAALYNFKNKTYGIADIIIRSDWINKLFENPILSEAEEKAKAPYLSGNYHYRVIDIKWTTMYLCSNSRTLRNSQRFPAYKGQLAIYNAALGLMQGYTPDEAFILSKSWNLNGGQDEGHNCFTLLGSVDFNDFDNKYIKETYDAIRWVRNVRYNGSQWTCNTPSVPELYPNMCNRYDTPYHSVKKDLADKIKEVTQIWMVGVKHRKIAHGNGIYSWDDPNCRSENIGIHGKKIGPVVDKIIEINRDSVELMKPAKIKNNTSNWKTKNDLDFYLDFEGITGCLYNKDINLQNAKADNQILFMIGVGYEENNSWVYKTFIANSVDRSEENKIVKEFINFIEERVKNHMISKGIRDRDLCRPRFFHWSHAEKSIFAMLDKRHNNEFYIWRNKVTWIDMCKVFIDEPIVIKGAKKFNLKEIAKTMVSHGMIQSKWNFNGPENGLAAMLEAIDYYRYMNSSNRNAVDDNKFITMMASIVDYNEIDCKVVWEIVCYLRTNHC